MNNVVGEVVINVEKYFYLKKHGYGNLDICIVDSGNLDRKIGMHNYKFVTNSRCFICTIEKFCVFMFKNAFVSSGFD